MMFIQITEMKKKLNMVQVINKTLSFNTQYKTITVQIM